MTTEPQNVVCISTIDWDFIWQGHQEIMSTLARQGHRVLFIENTGVRRVQLRDLPRIRHRLANWRKGMRGVRKVMDNLYVYSPLALPFPYSRLARFVNKRLMFWTLRSWLSTMRFDNPIVWTWLPTALALELIQALNAQAVVYYCCDDFSAISPGSRRIRDTEDRLIRSADLVFAHSKAMYDRCRQLGGNVHLSPYGFNRDVFMRGSEEPPADMAEIPRPILGYVGGIHWHVDKALLQRVAQAHPDKSLVLVGPLQMDVGDLARLPNVHFLGQKPYSDLPAYIKNFQVGLIPYVLSDYTRSVYPGKLNEYLIMGKPVVSTRLPEVEYFNETHQDIVHLARDAEDFAARISDALAGDTEALRQKRIRLVENNAWDKKIDAMQNLVQGKLEEKAKAREIDWQESLRLAYRRSRRKIAGATTLLALGYLLVFHSPALWWLAGPLRFEELPQAADAIVVLAGGIGESGEPGEAYQEKVKQGVDLYHDGYAPWLIFSSGEGYYFREAQVMKALAVSLGVPETHIILEQRGGGNYLSLVNVKRILDEKGWTRVLLVTSRYNAARSRMVAEKNLPAVAVHYTPAPNSAFFGEGREVTWKHLRAILHEYGAIAFYRVKGYI
jgi:glycosyltransferase involved in cell wall biosynthesis/uncharacterized SAM-binding protein YcdF (DUF218 family)